MLKEPFERTATRPFQMPLFFPLGKERPHEKCNQQDEKHDDPDIARPAASLCVFCQKIRQHRVILLLFLFVYIFNVYLAIRNNNSAKTITAYLSAKYIQIFSHILKLYISNSRALICGVVCFARGNTHRISSIFYYAPIRRA